MLHLFQLAIHHVDVFLFGILISSEFLLDRFHLLSKNIVPLVLLRRFLDARLQILLHLHRLQLLIEDLHSKVESIVRRVRFEQLDIRRQAIAHFLKVLSVAEGHVSRKVG